MKIGENNRLKGMDIKINDFKTYLISYVQENKNHNCMKFMVKTNSFIKIFSKNITLIRKKKETYKTIFVDISYQL